MDNSNRPSPDNDENMDKISVDEIIEKIRQELAIRQNRNKDKHKEFNSDSSLSFLFTENLASSQFKSTILSLYSTFSPKNNGEYHVRDLLHYHQEEFIKNAYIAALGRDADPVGLDIFLKRLSRGMSKIEILGRMRYSPEGRKKRAKIRGLLAPLVVQMTYKIPVLGYLSQLAISFLRLPKALKNHLEFEHTLLYQNRLFQTQLNQNFEAIDNKFFKLNNVIIEQGRNLNRLIGNLNTITKEFKEKADELTNYLNRTMNTRDDRINRLEETTHSGLKERDDRINRLEQSTQNGLKKRDDRINRIEELTHNGLKERDDRISLFEINLNKELDRYKDLMDGLKESVIAMDVQFKEMVKEEDHLLDAMYVSLEDRFRGTREDIKTLMKEFLPYIQDCKAGTADTPILDIGCGRGEWLELCKHEGLKASGVDINTVMISQCSEIGLDVTQADAIQFLKDQDSNKFGAITGVHFIEHIEHAERIAFFDEALRALKPGGVAIFETPNPENLIVGAFSFYIDPTHTKPLVPETMQFLLEQRGFVSVEIKRLHKNKAYYHKKTDKEFKNKWFFSEMDYAVIGYKK